MMIPLYKLMEEYQILYRLVSESDEPEAFETALSQIEGEIEVKAENIGLLIKSLEAEAKGIDAEIKRLSDRKRVRENHATRLKDYLQQNIPVERRFEFPLVTIAYAKNPPSVVILDESVIESQFIRIIPEQHEVNKVAVKDYWKETGVVPAGVHIETDNVRLVVK